MKNLLFLILIFSSTAAFASQSDSADYYFKKGVEEKKAGKFLIAFQSFEKATDFDPKFTEAFLQQGYTALDMRKLDKALNSFNKAAAIEPNNPVVIKELAQLYFNYRQYDKAIDYANKCKTCSFKNAILGRSYYALEDYASAEKYLLQAIKENGDDAEVAYALARTYLDLEAYQKAIPYYQKAVSLNNNQSTWMYELGLLQYNIANYKEAITSFTQAADKGYTQANDFKENLAYAYIYNNEFDKGEALLLDVLKRKAGNKTLLRDMATVFYEKKQYDKSLVYCQQLMEADDKDAKALYQAGLNFIKKGNKDRGQQMCDKAIEMDPSLESLRRKKDMPGM